MYTDRNFKTKKELKEALKAGQIITYHQPGLGETPVDGTIFLEGPHYPEAHRWYAECKVANGRIVSIK